MTDSVAIVTGAGSGIGAALAVELARRGVRVVVADIDGDAASRVAAAIGAPAVPRCVDVSREPDITAMVAETAAAYGRLDYQFNNAGIAIGGDARDVTLSQWRQVLDVDLNGVLYGTLAAYPIMARQGSGHIVNTASGAGLIPTPLNTPYCTAKHGVVGLSRALRLEGADLGVKVSVVCPGYVRTPIFDTSVVAGRAPGPLPSPPGRVRMMDAAQAARVILDGVARNRAVIAFPGYVRFAWRVSCLFPRLVDRAAPREIRRFRMARDPG